MDQDKREDSGAAYIPERYRQQFAARQRRRKLMKLSAVTVAIVCVLAAILLAAGSGLLPVPLRQFTPGPAPITPASTTTAMQTTQVTPVPQGAQSATMTAVPVANASGPVFSPAFLAVVPDTNTISTARALAFISQDYPLSAYTLLSGDITNLAGRQLYAFSLRPAGNTSASFTAYLDAATGDPYAPGQDSAAVSLAAARNTIADTFTAVHPDQIRVMYSKGTGIPLWNFTLYQALVPALSGSLDATSGQVRSFARNISDAGRPAAAAIDISAARKIAESYINGRNGPVAVNLSIGRYMPAGPAGSAVAGQYLFTYSRLVNGYPCDSEGFTVAVDSVSGEVTRYERRWEVPEFSFRPSPVPSVLQRDVTYTVLKKAQDLYPGLAPNVSIVSADIRWKDDVPAGTVPPPSAIPLAWKVTFTDELIRAMPVPVPAVAWVDAESGDLIGMDYQH
ncbi:MAG TPA: YcdB/YcdC domain-containing protein [Methanoregula sp.]|nr:YcdB/YcdC domain-containing protein [Methanoregula sp.]